MPPLGYELLQLRLKLHELNLQTLKFRRAWLCLPRLIGDRFQLGLAHLHFCVQVLSLGLERIELVVQRFVVLQNAIDIDQTHCQRLRGMRSAGDRKSERQRTGKLKSIHRRLSIATHHSRLTGFASPSTDSSMTSQSGSDCKNTRP